MFGQSLTLFRLFGIAVKVDASWLILAVLITWSLATGFFPARLSGLAPEQYWVMGAMGSLGLFLSIIFHEMAHSLVALYYRLPIRGITLFVFGGVAEMGEEPPHARAEFNIAIAGPAASLFLAASFWLFLRALQWAGTGAPVVAVMNYLVWLNGILAVFNMLPAFPLDGGRVFRAIRWNKTGDFRKATLSAAKLGNFFGIALMFGGVMQLVGGNIIGGLWWGMIGLFLKGAARSAELDLSLRSIFQNRPVSEFMQANPVSVPANISVQELVEEYIYRYHYDLFPVVSGGTLHGLISARQIREIPREEWSRLSIQSIMEACSESNTVTADEDANAALQKMRMSQTGRLLVLDQGRLVGILVLKDMLQLLSLKSTLEPEA